MLSRVFCWQVALARVTAIKPILLMYGRAIRTVFAVVSRVFCLGGARPTRAIGATSIFSNWRRFNLPTDTRRMSLFCVLLVLRRIARREGLLIGGVIVCANAVTCVYSIPSMQFGSETLNIHATCQLSTGIHWSVPRVCVGPPLW